MKMNKIVLASLLSVSLLGASTSVFADDTANTSTSFTVGNGELKFAKDAKNNALVTSSLTFKGATVADLLNKEYTDQQPFTATVNDTTGNSKQGWTMTATYVPLHNGDETLGETLTIGSVALKEGSLSGVAYQATPEENADALKNHQGNKSVGSETDAKLEIPSGTASVSGEYVGSIAWTLQATPENTAVTPAP
ncbi:hypothetical protein [Weissella confusa]|uniref:WxL domain-containing protein n=1 Tax=Weissella confusa TaxID=1583 RepID=A0A4Z0RXR7_WEICO|nr:hypothetical protein [Weissella confusa]TGE74428.1 hypothetical protein C6P11_03010 [Weissella confusa]